MSRFVRPLALALLAGTLLLGLGGALHPMLTGDAATDLAIIAGTRHWRAIHMVMLTGAGLVVAGLWLRLLDRPGGPVPVVATLAVIAIGWTLNALNIAYMARAGWRMGELFRAGSVEMVAIYDVTHPIALMIAWFGNLLVVLGALALGWIEWTDPARPRWLALLAWAAAAGGAVGLAFFPESSPAMLGAVALLSLWQVAIALRALRRPRAAEAPAPSTPAAAT